MMASLKRKSFFIDEMMLKRAKRALGVRSDAEAVRRSLESVAEIERFWRWLDGTRRSLPPGSIEPA
jgi:hypothetical protein